MPEEENNWNLPFTTCLRKLKSQNWTNVAIILLHHRYTPTHYIVRDSRGVSKGVGGYFNIKRGSNVCGIEDDMAVSYLNLSAADVGYSRNFLP